MPALALAIALQREARAEERYDLEGVPEGSRQWAQHWEEAVRRDFEIGPWLGWGAGVQFRDGVRTDVFSLHTGVEVTVGAETFGSATQYGGRWELRGGSWIGFNAPLGQGVSGEGGVTMIFTQTEHAQWGSFGLRLGAGHGAEGVTHLVATAWGGVRYVTDRIGSGSPGPFAKATGVRIVATCRQAVDPYESTSIVFGVELEPSYFLPPYSLRKWGGAH